MAVYDTYVVLVTAVGVRLMVSENVPVLTHRLSKMKCDRLPWHTQVHAPPAPRTESAVLGAKQLRQTMHCAHVRTRLAPGGP